MTYPVPVSQRASLARGEVGAASGVMHLAGSHYRSAVQTTAIRSTLPVTPEFPQTTVIAPRTEAARGQGFARKKVTLRGGRAIAPAEAPEAVHRAVAAANYLQRFPYKWGGGHARLDDDGYDCSGAVSYVLREAGLMQDQMTSRSFLRYGEEGQGQWITVWAREGHVFLTIGGLRFDTGGSANRTGPRWKPRVRGKKGLIARHPRGY